jgi:hypothetical protein
MLTWSSCSTTSGLSAVATICVAVVAGPLFLRRNWTVYSVTVAETATVFTMFAGRNARRRDQTLA